MTRHGLRLLVCVLGVHSWTTAFGGALYQQACRHCSAIRTR